MFALRGLAVSLSVFVVVYCAVSLAVSLAWRRVRLWAPQDRMHQVADLLFTFRMFPLATAALITATFTVPSFLLLEPREIDEPLGGIPLALGLFGAAVVIIGVGNAVVTLRRASGTISRWTSNAEAVPNSAPVPVLRISRTLPPMAAAGIVHPRILLSGAAEALLESRELRTAINHEVAHIRRRDNLKKLALRFVAFPGMRDLETAWLEATEMAADDAAVSNADEALDLAATLIKLSRLRPKEAPADLTAALVYSSALITNARVERLIAWSGERRIQSRGLNFWYGATSAGIAVVALAVTYGGLLTQVHAATEWFVR